MTKINRRYFLQGVAGALGVIGLSHLELGQGAVCYSKALAQTTPRKVALLIGINDYAGNALDGSLNDVELQRQLLIHRFGFAESDIHVLSDAQASRQNILTAFHDYLYEPAQGGDVVVLHFSGHGDRVRESDLMRGYLDLLQRNCIDIETGECFNTAIAPHRSEGDAINGVQDIMGHTLLLMRAALAQKTDNVTFVLDCCYAGGGKRGNAVMRSLNRSTTSRSALPQIADTEWEYQQFLMSELGWNEQDFANAIVSPKGPGFFVGAARYDQLAADYSFDGFTAGAFTYLLTQYLWQNTRPLSETIPMVTSSSTRLAEHSQQPIYDPQPSADPRVTKQPIYHIEPVSQPAEALVLGASAVKVEGNRLPLWLGGLDPSTLEAFDEGATFSLIDSKTGEELGEVRQVGGSRRGLMADGQIVSIAATVNPDTVSGQLLQEKVRGIPQTVTLKIGLDETLIASEQQVALDWFRQFPDFEVFPIQVGKFAHVLLGRYTEAIDQHLMASVATSRQTIGSIGLFSPTQELILADSFGPPGETMETAIERLRSRFISLYLGHMLGLMVNQQTAQIDVSVSVEYRGARTSTTTRGGNPDAIIIPQRSERGIEPIPVGQAITVNVQNNEARDLHFGLVVIDAAGEVSVLFPPPSDELRDVIAGGASKSVDLKSAEPYGITELLVLASPQSLASPLKKLRLNAPDLDKQPSRGAEVESVAAMDDIFGAMDTRRGGAATSSIQGPRLLDGEAVAVLSLLFEIMPGEG